MSALKLTPHARAQLLRFVRISGLAFVTALPATGHVSWASALALAAGAAEVGLRELQPTAPVPMVSAQPDRPTETAPPKG